MTVRDPAELRVFHDHLLNLGARVLEATKGLRHLLVGLLGGPFEVAIAGLDRLPRADHAGLSGVELPFKAKDLPFPRRDDPLGSRQFPIRCCDALLVFGVHPFGSVFPGEAPPQVLELIVTIRERATGVLELDGEPLRRLPQGLLSHRPSLLALWSRGIGRSRLVLKGARFKGPRGYLLGGPVLGMRLLLRDSVALLERFSGLVTETHATQSPRRFMSCS